MKNINESRVRSSPRIQLVSTIVTTCFSGLSLSLHCHPEGSAKAEGPVFVAHHKSIIHCIHHYPPYHLDLSEN